MVEISLRGLRFVFLSWKMNLSYNLKSTFNCREFINMVCPRKREQIDNKQ